GYVSTSNDTTNGITRTISFTMAKDVKGITIRLGNYGESKDVAAAYANVKLCEQNTDTNLISILSSDTISNSKENNKWYRNGYSELQSNSSFYTGPLTKDFANPTAKMVYIENISVNINDGQAIYNIAGMVPSKGTYILEFDYAAYGGAVPGIDIKYIDSSGTRQRYNNEKLFDVTNSYASFEAENHHASVEISLDNISTSTAYNFQVGFGSYNRGDGKYVRGGIYFSNITLKQNGSDSNILVNGDLSLADTGDVTSNNVPGWNVYDLSKSPYTAFKILKQPENFFTESGSDAKMALKLNGGNYDYVRQDLVLKSATKYRLSYKYLFVNAPCTQSIQEVNSANEYTNINATNSTFDKETRIKTVEFTTGDDLRETYQNAILMFLIQNNGKDVQFHFADVKLYEVDANGNNVGFNLINNGGFLFGEPTTLTDVLKSETSDSRNVDALELLGWQIQGTYEQNNNIEFVNITNQTFAPVAPTFMERIINIRNIILKIEQPTGSIYEDINGITGIDIRDLVATKEEEENYDAPDGAAPEAETWKKQYLNGNNATDPSLYANKTVYYVDSSAGNSGNGSKEKPYNELSDISNKSGSNVAVLFKCGSVFRPTSVGTGEVFSGKEGVLYGSYGTGAKPIISGSIKNYATSTSDWSETINNVWKLNASISPSVGIIVYKKGNETVIGNMVRQQSEVTGAEIGDFNHWTVYDTSTTSDTTLHVNCPENPADYWDSIEIGVDRSAISSSSNATFDNIAVMYAGYHGFDIGEGTTGITIQNCEASYIGGSFHNSGRLGNGIQFGINGSGHTVKNTYVSECYDAGITFQSWSESFASYYWRNLTFDNNLVENCHYSFEWFLVNQDDEVSNVTISNNIFRNAGYGWSYDERVGYGSSNLGVLGVSHFRVGGAAERRYTNMTNFTFTNNKLDTSKRGLVYWWWNDSDTEDNYDITGFTASGNSFYQLKNDENVISTYRDESPYYGLASYAIRETLKKFENTDAPTGKAETVLIDNTIIFKALTQ
ncbi:MAG: hypothetical protein J6D52_09305, partial [Clostridia bacterium]|nr:hypothetical protein [Clostridia bacterium]